MNTERQLHEAIARCVSTLVYYYHSQPDRDAEAQNDAARYGTYLDLYLERQRQVAQPFKLLVPVVLYGLTYLPFAIMEHERLIERKAKDLGLGDITVTYSRSAGGTTMNDATQTFAQKTTGWNWVAGGGFELWISRFIAMYSEMTLAQVKGSPAGGGEGGIDNRATLIVGGIRVRLGL